MLSTELNNAKLPCYTLPLMHHNFFRNLTYPPQMNTGGASKETVELNQ